MWKKITKPLKKVAQEKFEKSAEQEKKEIDKQIAELEKQIETIQKIPAAVFFSNMNDLNSLIEKRDNLKFSAKILDEVINKQAIEIELYIDFISFRREFCGKFVRELERHPKLLGGFKI